MIQWTSLVELDAGDDQFDGGLAGADNGDAGYLGRLQSGDIGGEVLRVEDGAGEGVGRGVGDGRESWGRCMAC